jgi:hypothetical protein
MFWMETDQFQKQFKNMSAPNRPKEAQRIFDKFLKPHGTGKPRSVCVENGG